MEHNSIRSKRRSINIPLRAIMHEKATKKARLSARPTPTPTSTSKFTFRKLHHIAFLVIGQGYLDTQSVAFSARVCKSFRESASSPAAFSETLNCAQCPKVNDTTLQHLLTAKRVRTSGAKRLQYVNFGATNEVSPVAASAFFSQFPEPFRVVVLNGSCVLCTSDVRTHVHVDTFESAVWRKWHCFIKTPDPEQLTPRDLDFALQPIEGHECYEEAKSVVLAVLKMVCFGMGMSRGRFCTFSDRQSTFQWVGHLVLSMARDGFVDARTHKVHVFPRLDGMVGYSYDGAPRGRDRSQSCVVQ